MDTHIQLFYETTSEEIITPASYTRFKRLKSNLDSLIKFSEFLKQRIEEEKYYQLGSRGDGSCGLYSILGILNLRKNLRYTKEFGPISYFDSTSSKYDDPFENTRAYYSETSEQIRKVMKMFIEWLCEEHTGGNKPELDDELKGNIQRLRTRLNEEYGMNLDLNEDIEFRDEAFNDEEFGDRKTMRWRWLPIKDNILQVWSNYENITDPKEALVCHQWLLDRIENMEEYLEHHHLVVISILLNINIAIYIRSQDTGLIYAPIGYGGPTEEDQMAFWELNKEWTLEKIKDLAYIELVNPNLTEKGNITNVSIVWTGGNHFEPVFFLTNDQQLGNEYYLKSTEKKDLLKGVVLPDNTLKSDNYGLTLPYIMTKASKFFRDKYRKNYKEKLNYLKEILKTKLEI